MEILNKIKQRILDITNPDVDYNQEDFDREFGTQTPTHNKFNINFTNKSTNQDPEYATSGSSGFDLRANLSEPVVISPSDISIIPTGLFFELPENFEIQVRPRSGLAAKNGVTVLNTPGTIDSDYRGEIKVILINHGKEPFTVNHGDRIAQGVIASVIGKNVLSLNNVGEITNDTERGSGGFGSTGKN